MLSKFLTVRNFTVTVVIIALLGLVIYAAIRDRSPSPPVNVSIVGPSTAEVGEMVALVVEGTEVDSYAWIVIPGSCEYRAAEGGRVLILVFYTPKEYTVVLGTSNGSGVELQKHIVTVGEPGPGPGPPPPPPPPPEPEPEPEPEPDEAWVKWVYEVAIATVTSPDRASQAALLAKQFESITAQIASGNIGTMKEARVKLRVTCNLALGENAIDWAAFSSKFSEHCIELEATGGLESLAQYEMIYSSAAKGLAKVAKENQPTAPCKKGTRT